jgi:hypothetical protein
MQMNFLKTLEEGMGESTQVIGIIFDSKTWFHLRINIKIEIKYRIEIELHPVKFMKQETLREEICIM